MLLDHDSGEPLAFVNVMKSCVGYTQPLNEPVLLTIGCDGFGNTVTVLVA